MARQLVSTGQSQIISTSSPQDKLAVGLKNILSTLLGAAKAPLSPIQRTASFAQDYAAYAPEAFKAGVADVKAGTPRATAMQTQKDLQAKYGMTIGREAGVGAEIAFLGAPTEGISALTKGAGVIKTLATSAKALALPGFAYGFTDPELKSLKDKVISGLTTAGAATIAAPIINKIFTAVGLGAAKTALSPKVSKTDPFAVPGNLTKATAEALKSTKLSDLSLGDIASSMGKVREGIAQTIDTAISKVTKVFNHSDVVGTDLTNYVKENAPRFKYQSIGNLLKPFTDIIQAVAGGKDLTQIIDNLPTTGGEAVDLVKSTAKEIVGYVRDMRFRQGKPQFRPVMGETSTALPGQSLFTPTITAGGTQPTASTAITYTLDALNKARMAVGELLADEGAWERMRLGKITKEEQQVGAQVYFYLRDLINKETQAMGEANVGALLNQEHLLYEAANGIADRITGATGRPSTLIRSAPGLAIRYLFDPISILMGRAAVSSKMKQAALMKLLNLIGEGGQAPTPQTEAPQTPNNVIMK